MTPASATEATPKVVVRKLIKADRESLFDAWIDPDLMKHWLFPAPDWSAVTENYPRVGDSYRHEMIVGESATQCIGGEEIKAGEHYVHTGEYLEIRRPTNLVFSWNSDVVSDTRVTVDFLEAEDGTEVVVTHELIPEEDLRQKHGQGWEACLTNLEACTGKASI